jgi:superoxide reductase
MTEIGELYQSADWKKEKHVPLIEAPKVVKKGEWMEIRVSIGKELSHPNTTEHHIDWIELYFHPKGEKFPYQIGRSDFMAHGASVEGPNTSTVYTHHETMFKFKTDKIGTLIATSYCNIHGLWNSSMDLKVE